LATPLERLLEYVGVGINPKEILAAGKEERLILGSPASV
jgi:hypothetical protein